MAQATPKEKPPTQIAGVSGIAAIPITMNELPAPGIDWSALVQHPPFQMFVAEKCPPQRDLAGFDDAEHASAFVQAHGGVFTGHQQITGTEERGWALLADYEAWHASKGYWPNETPMGVMKNA